MQCRALVAVRMPCGTTSRCERTCSGEPELDRAEPPVVDPKDVAANGAFHEKLEAALGRLKPTVWEPTYVTFTARQNGETIGYAIVVDEIGKVNPFTLIVSATPDFKVRDVAVMVYREPRGGEITQRRFLAQYKGKGSSDPILLNRDIVGIAGATLSAQGANRAVHKALAVLELVYK